MKPIDNYEDYLATEDGKIWSIKTQKFMSLGITTGGYYGVGLCKNGKYKTFRVNRLIALAFIPNPENKRITNHIDGNKLNNHVSNLEWVTDTENLIHAYKLGLKVVTDRQRKLASDRAKLKVGGKNPKARTVINIKTKEVYETIRIASASIGIGESYLGSMLRGSVPNNTSLMLKKEFDKL